MTATPERDTIGDRYRAVRADIAQAARAAGRAPEEITLLAVSKTWPAEAVVEAFQAGARAFGENRVEELVEKRAAVAALLGAHEAAQLRWHLIGELQSRKVRLLGDGVALVHSLDRASQLRAFAQTAAARAERPQDVLIEVNVGAEPQKGGVTLDALSAFAREVCAQPAVRLCGLMTIPPLRDSAEATRADFRALADKLHALRAELGAAHAAHCTTLSMGMSADYTLAIHEGATLVRVGTAIFGAR